VKVMNPKIEEKIAQMRCENRPVKQIAKKLGVNRDDIEAVIKNVDFLH
jgi:DNA-binding CsgD family transcriptional regulator